MRLRRAVRRRGLTGCTLGPARALVPSPIHRKKQPFAFPPFEVDRQSRCPIPYLSGVRRQVFPAIQDMAISPSNESCRPMARRPGGLTLIMAPIPKNESDMWTVVYRSARSHRCQAKDLRGTWLTVWLHVSLENASDPHWISRSASNLVSP